MPELPAANGGSTALEIHGLKVYFPVYAGLLARVHHYVHAVDDISFAVRRGSVFALVGESGCGKSTTALAVLNLVHKTAGEIRIRLQSRGGKPVSWEELNGRERRKLRGRMQVIFQDPFSSLNPRMTVSTLLQEPLRIHGMRGRAQRRERVARLLSEVGLSTEYLRRYPHEFSGGQCQRIGIARALATEPEIVIADEPVSALDVSIQAQIINLLQELQRQRGQTLLFISHDLAIVRHVADRIAVMYLGRIMEMGSEAQIFSSPLHPYTHLLLESLPVAGRGRSRKHRTEAERVEQPETADSCPFYPRCPERTTACLEQAPPLVDKGEGHVVACVNR